MGIAPNSTMGECMRPNEVVQFLCKDKNGKRSYPRETLDVSNGRVNWLPNYQQFELDTVLIPEGTSIGEVILDLQAGSLSCYVASILKHADHEFVYLIGSGWAERGFPFYDDSFDPSDPHIMGRGCYAFLQGSAKERFLRISSTDCLPDFDDCFKDGEELRENFILSEN
jgi:hypothetical protein